MANKALASVGTIDVVSATTNLIVESGGSIKRTSAKNLTAGIADGLLAEVGIRTEDLLSYGVSWSTDVADPVCSRVGNMQYHKDLPIQNSMKGCIAQCKDGARIMYYLNPTDWRLRADNRGYILHDANITVADNVCSLTDDVFSTLKYENGFVKVNNVVCLISSLDTTTKTIKFGSTALSITTGAYDVELGACLNGYDGEVMVEVPEFWIKSFIDGKKRTVKISPTKIDDTWEHQPRMLVSATRECVYTGSGASANSKYGYYGQFLTKTGMSIKGANLARFEGGSDGTKLGYPRTNVSRANMRGYVRNAGKELLSYKQYKNLYWLYVIEYANFNCQASFNSALTAEGYRQGGLGPGVTNYTDAQWKALNNYNPIVKCLASVSRGNSSVTVKTTRTVTVDSTATDVVSYIPYWHGIEQPFGDIYTNLDGIIIKPNEFVQDGKNYNGVYVTDNPADYSDSDTSKMTRVGVELNVSGYIKEFDLGTTAEIIPIEGGGSPTTYKCDNHYTSADNTSLRTLLVGGGANFGSLAGLGCFRSGGVVGAARASTGFRSCCVFK